MAVIKSKPTSPGRRAQVRVKTPDLHSGGPHKSLVKGKSSSGGRNNQGRMTVRHRGGGHKRRYRLIDFRRDKHGVEAVVRRVEYDPNRTAHIALLRYMDGEYRYVLAWRGAAAGDRVISGEAGVPLAPGNSTPLSAMQMGSLVHCVEMKPGKGAQIARSAGASAQLVAVTQGFASLRLRSGEVRRVDAACRATYGEVGNPEHNLRSLGKAGAKRWRGVRPTVRGVAMNPVDHPHGGGEGRTSGGRHPVTPWGVSTKGHKTRNNKRTNRFIVSKRANKRSKR